LKRNLNKVIFFSLLFSVIIFIQSELIRVDPLLDYDDDIIVNPLKSLSPPYITNYLKLSRAGKIMDVQPVRDLSYSLDLWIKSHFGIGFHHSQNVLIWFILLIVFYRLYMLLQINEYIAGCLVALYGLNPCFWNTLCWISGRKHLLSAMCITSATYIFLKTLIRDQSFKFFNTLGILILYTLACFSQPISLGWPAFVILSVVFYKKEEASIYFKQFYFKILLLGLLIIGSFCAYLNYQYYSGSYVASTGIVKFITNSPEAVSIKILSLGRSFLQSVFSFVPTPTPYYPGSILNLVGMTFLAISIFIMIKFRRRIIILFFIYSMLPLIVVNLKTTQVFGSDTYLLSTGIGIYLLIGILLNQFIKLKESFKSKLILIFVYIIFLIPYIYLSSKVSKSFETSSSLFERAYIVEPTPFNLRVFVYQTQERGEYEKAYPYALRLFEWEPYAPFVDLVFGITIYKNRILKNEEKIMVLQTAVKKHPDLPWIRYYLSLLYSLKGDYQRAFNVFEVFKDNDFLLFENDLSQVFGVYLRSCKFSHQDCEELEFRINRFRKSSPLWNEELFKNSLEINF
jgi:hypothetical protein